MMLNLSLQYDLKPILRREIGVITQEGTELMHIPADLISSSGARPHYRTLGDRSNMLTGFRRNVA
jgi:hypothetical protein